MSGLICLYQDIQLMMMINIDDDDDDDDDDDINLDSCILMIFGYAIYMSEAI